MCDLLDSMEEGRALRPPILTPARNRQLQSVHTQKVGLSVSDEKDIRQRTLLASERNDDLFYREALAFLSGVNRCATKVRQEMSDPQMRTQQCAKSLSSDYSVTSEVWLSASGSTRASYKHCLQRRPLSYSRIDLSEFPPCLRPCPLKDELNEEFAEKYEFLSRRLTLSKLLSLRDSVIQTVVLRLEVDYTIAAIAWTLMERLVSRNAITKENRKTYAAVCILLSLKFYSEFSKREVVERIAVICAVDASGKLTVKGVKESEFEVYAALRFDLLVDDREVQKSREVVKSRLQRLQANS